ncbi:MAG: tetratricopeptide repeat protein [Pseudomonadota bacterium]
MRTILGALAATIVMASPAAAFDLRAPGAKHVAHPQDAGVTQVQNRFLPGFLGGNENKPDNTALRIDQLETQVRMLTGQVEQLTFTVRRLEAALAGGAVPPQGDRRTALPPGALPPGALPPGATPGPGTPPGTLGTLPGTAPGALPGTGTQAGTAPAPALPSGPIDLSVLNQGTQGTPTAVPPATTPSPAAIPQSDSLANVRSLQSSGRYAMAAQEARAVLADNPTGPVSSEARFLLGEALLAQGDFRGAANQFLENYTSDPNGARAPVSLLKLSTALNGLGEREAACSSLEELFGAYPNVDPAVRVAAERERAAANCA